MSEPLLTWDKPLTSKQAGKYLLTNGLIAIEFHRAEIAELKRKLSGQNMAGENNWCEHCKEECCCVSSDGTCDMIRIYLRCKDAEETKESQSQESEQHDLENQSRQGLEGSTGTGSL
mgnify:CR=1 FL=1